MWRVDFSTLLFTRNSVLRGLARSQHSGMLQLINSLLKPCYIWHDSENKKQKTMSLPLKSLPINSQIHDLARIHWVVSDRNSKRMSLCKQQWQKKKKSDLLEWPWNISLNFSRNWTKHSGFLSSRVRKQGHQLCKFPVRPSDSTQYVLLGQKDPGKCADVYTSIQVTTPKPSILRGQHKH